MMIFKGFLLLNSSIWVPIIPLIHYSMHFMELLDNPQTLILCCVAEQSFTKLLAAVAVAMAIAVDLLSEHVGS